MLLWQMLSSFRAQGQYAATQLIFPNLGLKALCTAALLLLSCTNLHIFSCASLAVTVIAQQAQKTTVRLLMLSFSVMQGASDGNRLGVRVRP